LRELLRQFREGKVEDALRRALPLGPESGRGSNVAQDANLPQHNLGYRLGDYLGARAAGSLWLGGGSVYDDLHLEYRKAANAAEQRGDFLRAAVIWGKLLRDWGRMAALLARAGLHHDSALVYLEMLHDPLQAAREFEAAGEFDRALEVYAQRGEHALAGDLLRRIGEPERAIAEYLKAADQEASRRNHVMAARLLSTRAGRPDLAEPYLVAGWRTRPGIEANHCLLELLEWYTHQGDLERLRALVGEAEVSFAAPGDDYHAGLFFNRLARLARHEKLAGASGEFTDRALVGLATKLGERGREGDRGAGMVSMLFGSSGEWEPALVRDAEVALRAQPKVNVSRQALRRLATHRAELTAACMAGQTGDLFLGFADGNFLHFHVASGRVTALKSQGSPLVGLSCDERGSLVVFVLALGKEYSLQSYRLSNPPQMREVWRGSPPGLIPRLTHVGGSTAPLFGFWDGKWLEYRGGMDLCLQSVHPQCPEFEAAIVLGETTTDSLVCSSVLFEGDTVSFRNSPKASRTVTIGVSRTNERRLPWVMNASGKPGLSCLSWLLEQKATLEIVTLTDDEGLGWARLKLFPGDGVIEASAQTSPGVRFLCTALVGPGQIAGVHAGGVGWFRVETRKLQQHAQTNADLGDAVACFTSVLTGELLVLFAQGDLGRIPIPS
jgi:tetratricopeptide (TPR) repeat protein